MNRATETQIRKKKIRFELIKVEKQIRNGSNATADNVKRLESLKKACNPMQRNNIIHWSVSLLSLFCIPHSLPICNAQEINHGKVAAVKTDALETEIELRVEFRAKIKVKKTSAG